MKRLIHLIILSLVAASSQGLLPGLARASSIQPPLATQSVANPFVDAVNVTLELDDSTPSDYLIYYDLNLSTPFDLHTAPLYSAGTPVNLTSSTTMRAVACVPEAAEIVSDCSAMASFNFIKDQPPTVDMLSPTSGQIFRQNNKLTLKVTNAIDPDAGQTVYQIKYFLGTTASGPWTLFGQSTTGPTFQYDTTLGSATPPGQYYVYAEAMDSYGATGTSTQIPIKITAPNQTPLISITSPITGAAYTSPAVISLTATASDPDVTGGGITKVEFYRGGTLLGTAITVAPYTYSWTGVAVGSYDLTAKAYDNNSPPAITTSAPVTVTVAAPANKLPVVSITSPANSAFFYTTATIPITVSASDSDGSISKVAFYSDADSLGETAIAPFSFSSVKIPAGTHVLTAKAFDNVSAFKVSSGITIEVAANQPPSANAGLDTAIILPNTAVILKGTASDPENGPMTYQWTGPAGVTFTGASTLTPTATFSGGAKDYLLSLKATDGGTPPLSFTSPITVSVRSAPSITSPTTASGIALQPFSYTVTATGFPIPTLTTGVLPSWLRISTTSGLTVLSGTPPVAGPFSVTLTATNTVSTDSKTLSISIAEDQTVPVITSAITASGAAKQPFSYTLTATGKPTPVLTTTGMPSWLTWTPATGILAGTPTSKSSFSLAIQAKNAAGVDDKTLTITIGDSLTAPIITSSLSATAKIGSPFTYAITATGTSPITFTATPLPAGLSLAGSTISGTPTAAATTNISLKAANVYGSDSKSLALIVASDPAITTNLPDSISINEKSSVVFTITATGYPAVSYQWEYAGSNNIFGTVGTNAPTYTLNPVALSSAGQYRVTVKNGIGPNVVSKICRLIVKGLPTPIAIITQPVGVNTTVGKPVTFKAKATGSAPLLYQWFKNNVAITANPLANDTLYNIPSVTQAQAGDYKVRVTNSFTVLTDPTTFAESNLANLIVQLPKLPMPKTSIPAGPFKTEALVMLSNDTAGTTTYFTLNGSTPSQANGTQYNNGMTINIGNTTTLKAASYKAGWRSSDTLVATYTYTPAEKVVKPAIKPLTPNFKVAMNCTLSTETPGAEILYSMDGSDPLGPSGKVFTGFIPLSATTTITAIARHSGMTTSDTLVKTYTMDKTVSKTQPPLAVPSGGNFNTQIMVTLTSPTDSAVVHYTTDGSPPDSSDPIFPVGGMSLTKTTLLRAIATRKDFSNSDTVSWKFIALPIISAMPVSGTVFEGQALINLSVSPANAVIHYSLDGTSPSDTSSVFPSAGLLINQTTTLSAIATLDGVTSPVSVFSYSLKGGQLATPSLVTDGSTSTFKDVLKISILATPGSKIYYTLNGDLPTTGSTLYTGPFIIDTTTTVQAMAVQTGFQPSRILFATYVLIPEAPLISPVGGHFISAQKVTIASSSNHVAIFYTLDESVPTPGNSLAYHTGDTISISTSTTLKAIAAAGNMVSPIREEIYGFFQNKDTLLQPGDIYYLDGGYTIRNPEDQSAIVHIQLTSADSLKLKGFEGVQYVIRLDLADSQANAPEFPKVTFVRTNSDKRSLYKRTPSGQIFFLSNAETDTLNQAGTYFMGIDISPPQITYLGETIDQTDSTMISFLVEDNVANLTFDFKRSDDPLRNLNQQSLVSPGRFGIKLKNPVTSLKSLNVQLSVSDYSRSSYCPPTPPAVLPLSQSFGKLVGPPAWGVGLNTAFPFDLISIPLDLDPPLTLASLSKNQAVQDLKAVAWDNTLSKYVAMPETEVLKPGQAYWIASHSKMSALNLPVARTSAHGPGSFKIKLKKGWNQIANPHLDRLYWPISRTFKDTYHASLIKAPWSYNPGLALYEESPDLEPWRGYYVLNYGDETTVELSSQPVLLPVAKQKALFTGSTSSDHEIDMALGWGRSQILRLGADYSASDNLGVEDEMELPRRKNMTYLAAIRNGKSLATDWIRMRREAISEWKIALGGQGDSLPSIRIFEQAFPPGYEAWAVSLSRSMKFKLEMGQSIPASGLANDTLVIYAGPSALLAGMQELRGMATQAPELNLMVFPQSGGFAMELALPARARIQATVWGLDGTRKGTFKAGPIAPGTYRFDYNSEFQGRGAFLQPGIYFLSIDLQGKDIKSRMARKIILGR